MKRAKKTVARGKKIPRIVSIPPDVVLSPSSTLSIPAPLRGVDRSAGRAQPVAEMLWSQFDRMVQALAREIHSKFRPDAVVGIAHGGVFVGGALARALECEFFPVRISRRSRDKSPGLKPRQLGEIPRELKGKKILVVDDVASSGDTLQLAHALLLQVGAKDIRTACLVSREHGFSPDWSAMESDALLIFPWDYQPVTEDGRFNR